MYCSGVRFERSRGSSRGRAEARGGLAKRAGQPALELVQPGLGSAGGSARGLVAVHGSALAISSSRPKAWSKATSVSASRKMASGRSACGASVSAGSKKRIDLVAQVAHQPAGEARQAGHGDGRVASPSSSRRASSGFAVWRQRVSRHAAGAWRSTVRPRSTKAWRGLTPMKE